MIKTKFLPAGPTSENRCLAVLSRNAFFFKAFLKLGTNSLKILNDEREQIPYFGENEHKFAFLKNLN